jgi:hypothetical protein
MCWKRCSPECCSSVEKVGLLIFGLI